MTLVDNVTCAAGEIDDAARRLTQAEADGVPQLLFGSGAA